MSIYKLFLILHIIQVEIKKKFYLMKLVHVNIQKSKNKNELNSLL